jgi:hypothetical protein
VINIEEKIPVLKVLRWMFRKLEGVVGTGWSWIRIGQVAGACKYGKEPSGSIKCGEFLG